MEQLLKPVQVALKGKGLNTLLKRVWTINKRYGLTPVKMDLALHQLSRLLTLFDCRATLPITAVALGRNARIIQTYQVQGIEFAVHGLVHVDYSQLSLAEQQSHFKQAAHIFKTANIDFAGFRCPYLRSNENTMPALKDCGYQYDSSPSLYWSVDQNHITESYTRVLDFYGAKSIADYPSLPELDLETGLVRIPYSLPDDESLIERLAWSTPREMIAIWPSIFKDTYQKGELFNLGLHPERMPDCAEALIATLSSVQAYLPFVWRARLSDIARWWQAHAQATINLTQPDGNTDAHIYHLQVIHPTNATLLTRSVTVKSQTEPWFNGYQRAIEQPCHFEAAQRPFIGLSPDVNPALTSFLKEEGYIVETTTDSSAYPLYFAQKTFTPSEKRTIIQQIETADFPLVRLGRWPNGNRSALCITGDIDSLTLLDYGARFMGA